MNSENRVDVLLVEDDPNDAALAKRVLKGTGNIGYFVDHVSDGFEAKDYFSDYPRTSRRPRLILLDLKLPKLDGFAVLQQLRLMPEWTRVPVVVLSSSSIESDVFRSYDLGANAYVVKPIRYDEYKNAMERIARFWLETAS